MQEDLRSSSFVTPLLSAPRTWIFSSCMRPSATSIDTVTMLRVRRSMPGRCQVLPQAWRVTSSCSGAVNGVAFGDRAVDIGVAEHGAAGGEALWGRVPWWLLVRGLRSMGPPPHPEPVVRALNAIPPVSASVVGTTPPAATVKLAPSSCRPRYSAGAAAGGLEGHLRDRRRGECRAHRADARVAGLITWNELSGTEYRGRAVVGRRHHRQQLDVARHRRAARANVVELAQREQHAEVVRAAGLPLRGCC